MHTSEYDYLIIGGGPAGATAARMLAQSGYRVALTEKNFNYNKPCGGGVKTIVFDEFDIPITLERSRISTFNLFSPKRKRACVDLTHYPISIVDRQTFDQGLRQLAADAGAILIHGKYKSLQIDPEKISVSVLQENELRIYKSKYVIAADGANSTVRKTLLHKAPDSVMTHYRNISESPWNSCDFYFGNKVAPHHYGWVFPHNGGVNIGVAIEKKSFIDEFSNSIINNHSKTKGHPIPLWNGDLFSYRNRVFFVGDAAGQVLPFTYEGIYYAIKSASILVNAIRSGNIEAYEQMWKAAFEKRFKFFKRMQKIFLCCNGMSELMIRAFATPRFQKRALGYWMGTFKPLGFWKTFVKLSKIFSGYYQKTH